MGTKFKVRTGCASLLYLDRIFSEADPHMIKKFHKLDQYNFTIEHISGKSKVVSDFLSRHLQLKDAEQNHCSTTSKAERTNKRLNQALRLVLNDDQMSDWDLYLNYVCIALNSVKSRHTGYSANMAVFGRELNTPLSVLVENENSDLSSVKNKSYGQAIWEHHRLVQYIVSNVSLNASRDFGYADNANNKHFKPSAPLSAGDYVYTLVNCPSHKFQKRGEGRTGSTK